MRAEVLGEVYLGQRHSEEAFGPKYIGRAQPVFH